MADTSTLTQGMTDLGNGLWMDAQGNVQQLNTNGAVVPNAWSWGSGGLTSLGGNTPNTITPYLDILEQYANGQSITGYDNWQDAAKNSLTGFMQYLYNNMGYAPQDPETIWDPSAAGQLGSQFRIGTLEELLQDPTIGPNLFGSQSTQTLPALRQNQFQIMSGTSSWKPDNLSQADIASFQQSGIRPDQGITGAQWGTLTPAAQAFMQGQFALDPQAFNNANGNPFQGLSPQDKLLLFNSVPTGSPLEKLLGLDSNAENAIQLQGGRGAGDFNDWAFKLDLNQVQEAPTMTQGDPTAVLKKWMQTPEFQLMYGNSGPGADATKSPLERFQANPGYQFQQQEGANQIQNMAGAKGMLNSTPTLQGLQDRSMGIANQEYNNWSGQQNQMFNNYLNRLQGVSTQGQQAGSQQSSQTNAAGGTQAQSLSNALQNLSSLLNNTGSGMASTYNSMGSNISQLQGQAAMQAAASSGGGGGMGGLGSILGMGASLIGSFF